MIARAVQILGRTPVPTPEPVAIGEPGVGYPLPWAVQSWLPGTDATVNDPSHSTAFAHDLAEFIRDVRRIETRGSELSVVADQQAPDGADTLLNRSPRT